jgi:hypothetical protein
MKTIRYHLQGADEAGIKGSAYEDVESLGMKITRSQGESICGCIFMEVENIPDKLPDYIEESEYQFE